MSKVKKIDRPHAMIRVKKDDGDWGYLGKLSTGGWGVTDYCREGWSFFEDVKNEAVRLAKEYREFTGRDDEMKIDMLGFGRKSLRVPRELNGAAI